MNVREKVDELYKVIADADEELKKIRSECTHKKTHEGEYRWAPVHTYLAEICDDCDTPVRNLNMSICHHRPL